MSGCVVKTVIQRVFVCRDMADDNSIVQYAVWAKVRARVKCGGVC